jgi:hypothetical protein
VLQDGPPRCGVAGDTTPWRDAATDGWDTARLTPLLAGLQELMPWLHQWHNEMTDLGQSYADAYGAHLTSQREQRNLTADVLRTWLSPQAKRVRRG